MIIEGILGKRIGQNILWRKVATQEHFNIVRCLGKGKQLSFSKYHLVKRWQLLLLLYFKFVNEFLLNFFLKIKLLNKISMIRLNARRFFYLSA